ncbi:hypothetical protein HK405_015387 [Cladochytrium tenue]|nr:hypothetical protein HK405_015387 [Cladochytrium tenue]
MSSANGLKRAGLYAGGQPQSAGEPRKRPRIKHESENLADDIKEEILDEVRTTDAGDDRPAETAAAAAVREREVILPKKATVLAIPGETTRDGIVRDLATQFFEPPGGVDYSFLAIKPDAKNRPLWVADDGKIFLEAFSPQAAPAQDFLITIAEPVSRPSRIHEYRLTTYSLYAAVSVGMETNTLLDVLERYSKVKLPERVVKFIKECTLSYGKVKLVLKHNRYFLESHYPEVLRLLLKDPIISDARVTKREEPPANSFLPRTKGSLVPEQQIQRAAPSDMNVAAATTPANAALDDSAFGAVIFLDQVDDADADGEADFAQSFEIQKAKVEDVKKRCSEMDYPLMEEYDFRHDDVNPNLDIDLSPKCTIRDYQEKSLSKMFGGGGGRARSGIIVLPTGAGKTLVGITAACTVKKSTLVLCTNAISVEQWANEFRNWSTIAEDRIAKFTSQSKSKFAGDSGIVVSTYTMITHQGTRSWETGKMIEFINSREWGLLILDEVHVVPANVFRRVITTVAAQTKLGLTATLVREDEKIADLNFLIGPKLYEANWMDLAGRGHIAKVEFMATQYLIRTREAAGDKIIVFSDNVLALVHYARALKKPHIYGRTQDKERMSILNYFREGHPSFQTIFLSKVGDTSLDLPEATCLIQISSQFGSRRQEAQRMGRILRAKRRNEEGFRSRFYTLVSQDTDEVAFSDKRKRFLIDQGYQYKVISNIKDLIPDEELSTLMYSSKREQGDLLTLVLNAGEEAGDEEELEVREDDLGFGAAAALAGGKGKGRSRRQPSERAKQLAFDKKRNPLFRKFYKKTG